MSTNKTEHHALHAWEPEDDFLLSEFNENFAAIDGLLGEMPHNKKLRIAAGSYVGTTASTQAVVLGFRPRAVCVTRRGGADQHNLSIDGAEDNNCSISDSGFTVSGMLNVQLSSESPYNGQSINPYRYIAFYWEE